MSDNRTHFRPLDFDRLSRLAVDDPAGFEAERERLVQCLIKSAPRRQQVRLRGLQWRVDNIRRCSPSPYIACRRISSMMWERIVERGGLLDAVDALQGKAGENLLYGSARGTVLPFRRPRGKRA